MAPVNDQQPDDSIRFLKLAEIFEALGEPHLRIIFERGTVESYHTPGGILFQLGDPADALYVVKSGVVEICRARGEGEAPSVVAYLGEGDTIGEMAITTGSPRGSLARVPQAAEVYKLSKPAFEALMRGDPGVFHLPAERHVRAPGGSTAQAARGRPLSATVRRPAIF